MILNPTSIAAGAAFVIHNLRFDTVLDLSGTNHVNGMSYVSEIIYRFDALTKLPHGLLTEERINKCVEILLLGIRSSDLGCHIVDVKPSGLRLRFVHHPKCGR
jgi:hypothetical protein